MNRLELDRFVDLHRQGFMKDSKPKKLTAAEKKAKAELDAKYAAAWAKAREEEAARYDAWFAEDDAMASAS